MTMAAEDPNHVPNQKAVVHCIAQGLADIRAVYCRTSRPGTLHSEALRLITALRTIDTSQGDVLFLRYVDSLWTRHRQMWGDLITHNLLTTGSLNNYLPS